MRQEVFCAGLQLSKVKEQVNALANEYKQGSVDNEQLVFGMVELVGRDMVVNSLGCHMSATQVGAISSAVS